MAGMTLRHAITFDESQLWVLAKLFDVMYFSGRHEMRRIYGWIRTRPVRIAARAQGVLGEEPRCKASPVSVVTTLCRLTSSPITLASMLRTAPAVSQFGTSRRGTRTLDGLLQIVTPCCVALLLTRR